MNKEIYGLLKNKNEIYLSMIEMLQTESDWLRVDKISNELKISCRSSQRFISNLKDIIEDCNQEKDLNIQFYYEKFKGIKLETDTVSIEILKMHILHNDENIKLLFDISLSKSKDLNKYAEENRLSSYAVRNSIVKINRFLRPHKLKISTTNLIIIGEEKRIRFYLYFFLWEISKNLEWPFYYVSKDKIYQSIELIEENYGCTYSDEQKKHMAYFIAICLIRIKKNFCIQDIENWNSYLNLPTIKKDKEINGEMNKYHIFKSNEVLFFLTVIQINFGLYQSSKIKSRILNYHKKYDTDIYKTANIVFLEFQKTFFEIPKDYNENFYNYIFCTHFQVEILSDILLNYDGYNVLEINSIPDRLIEKIKAFIKKMREITGSEIFYMEDILVRRYIWIFLFFEDSSIYEPQIVLGIDSDMPFFLRELFKKKISRHFDGIYNLRIIDSKIESRESDLIITNSLKQNSIRENNICVLSYSLTSNDYLMIEKKIKEFVEDQMIK